jgi:hypothetical protein
MTGKRDGKHAKPRGKHAAKGPKGLPSDTATGGKFPAKGKSKPPRDGGGEGRGPKGDE